MSARYSSSGIGDQQHAYVGFRRHHGGDVAAFGNDALGGLGDQLLLPRYEIGTHIEVGGNRADSLRNLGSSDGVGDIDSVDRDSRTSRVKINFDRRMV